MAQQLPLWHIAPLPHALHMTWIPQLFVTVPQGAVAHAVPSSTQHPLGPASACAHACGGEHLFGHPTTWPQLFGMLPQATSWQVVVGLSGAQHVFWPVHTPP